jgi:hypothetical protein
MDDQKENLIYGPHLQSNLSTVFNIKFLVAIFSGATAGVLGFTNLSGFLLFGASILLSAALVVLIKCGGNPALYIGDGTSTSTRGAIIHLLTPGVDNLFGFILTWTLFYGKQLELILPTQDELTIMPGIIHGVYS